MAKIKSITFQHKFYRSWILTEYEDNLLELNFHGRELQAVFLPIQKAILSKYRNIQLYFDSRHKFLTQSECYQLLNLQPVSYMEFNSYLLWVFSVIRPPPSAEEGLANWILNTMAEHSAYTLSSEDWTLIFLRTYDLTSINGVAPTIEDIQSVLDALTDRHWLIKTSSNRYQMNIC